MHAEMNASPTIPVTSSLSLSPCLWVETCGMVWGEAFQMSETNSSSPHSSRLSLVSRTALRHRLLSHVASRGRKGTWEFG